MTNKDTLPVWKKLYQVVSGSNEHVTRELIDDILEICQEKLVSVLLDFKLYTKKSFEDWKKVSESMLISQDDEMCSFIHRMSKELDLDVNIAWSVICNFLIFDYYGKVDELKSIIRYEANIKSIIDHVWYFYSADRMFLLKTLRYIFENLTERDHEFFEQFHSFIDAIDVKKLWQNLIKTFEYLITEVDKDKSNRVSSDTLTRWVQRNNREQTEVLLLMTHVINLIELDGEELQGLLKLFMRHGFGRHPLFFGAGTISRPKDIIDIKNAEIGVILTLIHRYWQNNGKFKMIPKDIEKDLENYQIQGDNSAILFIWAVFKSSLSEDNLDYCRNVLDVLLPKKVFKSLADFITLNIFENCKVGEIIIEGINRLFLEFIKMVEDTRFIYEQDGVVQIICELFKRPYLQALDNFGQFFQIGLDMFPYILDNFLDMVEALVTSDEHYTKEITWGIMETYEREMLVNIIKNLEERRKLSKQDNKRFCKKEIAWLNCMASLGDLEKLPVPREGLRNLFKLLELEVLRLLHNCPSYCTELSWPYASDAVYSIDERNLFLGTDRFIIPIGTLTERCSCYGEDVIKFNYKYDYFQVIEQYMRSLTMWAVNRGEYNKLIFDYVVRAYKFLIFLVKNFKGNFHKEKIIRPLIQRLDCVPTYYNKGGFKNFDFFYIYFEAKCAIVMYQNIDFHEAFPLIIRKSLFPNITDYIHAKDELKMLHSSNECFLWNFLKEEESLKNHRLLLKYVEILLDILKKDILHKEVLYSGLWYLLNVVFPTHQQWNYDEGEPFQQVKIINVCLQVFTKVFQQDPRTLSSGDQKLLYFLVHDSFLKNQSIINSLCSVFVKDKFYLQNLMHQESNWIGGPTLVVIETVRLELVLLLLIYKCRAKIPRETCMIDDRTHIFAKSASAYFINSYNCTLAVLAGRFLEILARDENIPLMSCLGLDHEQVQTLFLERLRDPMEDDDVKLNILDLISSCIFHQTGMTAAFFNVQSSKKWYNTDSTQKIDGDTVGDFMVDYLQNIKKSLAYLKSPLQVGILRVMANLWQCEKQHLIKEITALPTFWPLLADPLFRPFDQSPLIYSYILKILSIQLIMALRKPEGQEKFFSTLQKFLTDQKQLRLFQQYFSKTFSVDFETEQDLSEKELLLQSWSELLVTAEKQKKVSNFPNSECKYLFVELAFDGFKLNLVHQNLFSSWLDFMLVVIDMFGLKFEQRYDEISRKAVDITRIIKTYYEEMTLKDKRTALTIILKTMTELKDYHDDINPTDLGDLLEEIGPLVDTEHAILEESLLDQLKSEDPSVKENLGPWALVISIANFILTSKSCKNFALWFSTRRYLTKVVKCTCDLLMYKDSLPAGKLALYSMTLYVQSPLAYDFIKINMLRFFDRVEPMVNTLLTGPFGKINALELKEAWIIYTLIMKFNQALIRRFQKSALETCYAFLTLNEHILKHVMHLPENTVDFKALDLLTQTLVFYDDILTHWKVEWYRKSNKTFTFMIDGIRKVINSCVYLCLRPKHIGFYYLDNYYRLITVDQESESINDLMISVINRLTGILNLAFSCLYKVNSCLPDLLDLYEPDESVIILIHNDFSVPRFELPISSDLTYGKLLCLAHFLCKTMNQLHQKKGGESLEIDEKKYAYYVGLVEHQNPSDYMPNQKLSSFLRYLYEYSGLIDPWINNLNYTNVQKTADMLMMFIAQQAFLTIKILEPHQVPYYKRNLYSELQFFNEYVKKRTSELELSLASSNQVLTYKADMDVVKRYLLYYWSSKNKDKKDEIVDQNFLLVISFWFSNICQIQ